MFEINTVMLPPEELTPPHKVTRPEQVAVLAECMNAVGWVGPALVGYWDEGGVQLLSGTHRRSGAILAGLKTVPVVVWNRDAVEQFWGTVYWRYLMESGNDY